MHSVREQLADHAYMSFAGYTFQSGIEDAVIRNIQAVAQITEIVRTSFGPNGRNKMVINVSAYSDNLMLYTVSL
jgi:hypothetical protein